MSTYPVVYQQNPPVERNRLTVFFRLFMLIPHWIWICIYGIGAIVVVFCAWFAILVTGRYPDGMYNFVAGFLRYSSRVNAYSYLISTSTRRSTAASTRVLRHGEHRAAAGEAQPADDVLSLAPVHPGLHRRVRVLDLD